MKTLKHGDLSRKIIAAAHNVHKELGQGFLEKVHKNALAIELQEGGINYALEVPRSVLYRGVVVGDYVADMIADKLRPIRPGQASRLRLRARREEKLKLT